MREKVILLFIIFSLTQLPAQQSSIDSLPDGGLLKIQVALLIDVSGSMDGLINQTQGQLWKMANFLTQLKKGGQIPIVELALISYGGIEYEKHKAINLESPLDSDLDLMAERLFQLQAQGSQEHCAEALQMAMDSLEWTTRPEDLRVIIIAGNEPFDQGRLDFHEVCQRLKEKHILLNTIYCGDYLSGIDHHWQKAAEITDGKYANINQNIANEQMDTPYDPKIAELYRQYKKTLIPYGPHKDVHKRKIEIQDNTVKKMGNVFYRDRILFLISRPPNPEYPDLIDLFEQKPDTLDLLDFNELPLPYQNMNPEELRKSVIQLQYKRNMLRDAILLYSQKIEDFLKVSLGVAYNESSLETVLLQILKEQSLVQGFE